MKLKDILDNTDAPIFVRVTFAPIFVRVVTLKNAVVTQEIQTSQTVGLLSETIFANDVVFDHNISYPEYYRPYREYSVDVITVDNYITDKITESNIPYLDVTISRSSMLIDNDKEQSKLNSFTEDKNKKKIGITYKDLSSVNMQNLIADTVRDTLMKSIGNNVH